MNAGIQEVGWVVLPTKSINTVATWIRDVLGLTIIAGGPDGPICQFDAGPGLIIELVSFSRRKEEMPRRFFYNDAALVMRTYNLDEVIEQLKAKDVPFISDVVEVPSGRLIFFHDPEGHVFALQERSPESTAKGDDDARKRWESPGS